MKRLLGLSKIWFSVFFAVVCVLGVLGVKFSLLALAKDPGDKAALKSRGNPQAGLYIIEYIDFQCPACARGAKVLDEYFRKYPQRMFLEARYFPLPMHRHGLASAHYVQCAAEQGKFWPFYEALLRRQNDWSNLTNARPLFREIARGLGIDLGIMDKCLEGEGARQAVDKDQERGKSLGIKSTPTYFINGTMIVGKKELERKLSGYFSGKIE
ncbi:MAG: DsbA family protein [Candidatus Omnitrophota bacterium]